MTDPQNDGHRLVEIGPRFWFDTQGNSLGTVRVLVEPTCRVVVLVRPGSHHEQPDDNAADCCINMHDTENMIIITKLSNIKIIFSVLILTH